MTSNSTLYMTPSLLVTLCLLQLLSAIGPPTYPTHLRGVGVEALDHDTAPVLIAGRYVWEGAASGALAPGGQLVTITGDTQGVFSIPELLTRGYQLVSRKLYCWLVIGGGASYHQVNFLGWVSSVLQSVLPCRFYSDPCITK